MQKLSVCLLNKRLVCKAFFALAVLSFSSLDVKSQSHSDSSYGGFNMGMAGEAAPPVWPLPNTEQALNPNSVDSPFGSPSLGMPSTGWSGGADTVATESDAMRYSREEQASAYMPLGTKDMMVDDGVKVLSSSIQFGGGFGSVTTSEREVTDVNVMQEVEGESLYGDTDVKDWIAKEGLTLREVLEEWAKVDGWEIIWSTHREYPLQASAVFRGRFKDVTAAIIRGFSRAAPPPYAKFYLGNRVIVIKTMEDDND